MVSSCVDNSKKKRRKMAKMVLAMSSPLSFCSIGRANSSISSPLSSYSLPIPLGAVRLQSSHGCISTSYPNLSVVKKKNLTKIRSVAEEETLIPEEQVEEEGGASSSVSVPVSPSDVLAMFFQAEGTMSEAAIPTVTNALQETEGISNLRVQVLEGIASVELKKQTTVQATGVASNLVEIIQGSGFKLQTLNLSFEDDDVS